MIHHDKAIRGKRDVSPEPREEINVDVGRRGS